MPPDLTAYPLMDLQLVPVVAPNHPLSGGDRPLTRVDLEGHIQLVLSDPHDQSAPGFGIVGSRLWRFVDLSRRLDFLLAGFGWCKMPRHLIGQMLADGRLIELDIQDESIMPTTRLLIYAAHAASKPLGKAGAQLMNDLRRRLSFSN